MGTGPGRSTRSLAVIEMGGLMVAEVCSALPMVTPLSGGAVCARAHSAQQTSHGLIAVAGVPVGAPCRAQTPSCLVLEPSIRVGRMSILGGMTAVFVALLMAYFAIVVVIGVASGVPVSRWPSIAKQLFRGGGTHDG